MTRIALLLACIFMLGTAQAQYDGPAVEACRSYAKREAARDGASVKDVVFERDQALAIERYTRKLGSQFVSSILTGNGAVVYVNAPSAELAFICLLADEKRPVFFEWLPRQDTRSLAQCTRDGELRDKPRPCLETLLQTAENDLIELYAQRFQEANARGAEALASYRKANDEWRQYREAECSRRRDYAPAAVNPDDYQMACIIDLTRRRAVDMR